MFVSPEEQAVASAEAGVDPDPAFDITFSEGEEEKEEKDLDDFMKSAFDPSESEGEVSPPEGLDEGFDLTIEAEKPSDDGAEGGALSFDIDDPEETVVGEEVEGESPLSADGEIEFDVLLEELLQEDAENGADPEDDLSLEPQGDTSTGDDVDDNLPNEMLEPRDDK